MSTTPAGAANGEGIIEYKPPCLVRFGFWLLRWWRRLKRWLGLSTKDDIVMEQWSESLLEEEEQECHLIREENDDDDSSDTVTEDSGLY